MGRGKLNIPQRFFWLKTQSDPETSEKATHRSEHWLKGKLGSWKGTILLGSISCVVVLCINVIFVAWAASRQTFDNRLVLYSGGCDKTKQLSIGIHLMINIFSTVLLAASNFALQCLCAPTRETVDRAHKSNHWLDIGVPSIRNLSRIPVSRFILWTCLALSSLPLHLFYNSTVFYTIGANAYDVYVANSSFTSLRDLDGLAMWSASTPLSPVKIPRPFSTLVEKSVNNTLTRLSPEECVSAYATNFQTKYGSLVLITDGLNTTEYDVLQLYNQSVVRNGGNDPYRWICEDWKPLVSCSLSVPDIKTHSDNWIVSGGYKIESCLAEPLPEKCMLECSFPLAMIIIATNLAKAIIICFTAFYLGDSPLLTTGDAVASFIKEPDETTKGVCLLSKNDIPFDGIPLEYNDRPKRWASAASKGRWAVCVSLNTVALGICGGLLAWGLVKMQMNGDSHTWNLGFGVVNPQTFITGYTWPSDLITNTIIANTPQVVFSILYLTVNSVWTSMTLAAEWNSYSVHRKGLRVSSHPQGHQRTTYFLSLPYRYAFPLIACSAILHWLISQSLYLVSVEGYDEEGHRYTEYDLVTCAYSPVGIICSLCVAGSMLVLLSGAGFQSFKTGMPVAGSCSLAIAAACHSHALQREDLDSLGPEYNPLQWGVEQDVPVMMPSHCTFSKGEVETPQRGFRYE
ncbi:hypothetical protein FE257_000775 [Aspergillus nanangensis]|uniref:DUF6536 domain-containing protein n=1 Tax=Aspergillus nanangensis TaxID=2582783 RepID=A0AAD4GPB2_ASPNN|nr:hypothetical protein FE257_000775 [Aspergillus nanangensis]